MREFMTKVSDYWNERRNNPERQEDRLAIVIIGAVAVVVIVALLLVLWGHNAQERRDRTAREQEAQEQGAPEQETQAAEDDMLTAASYVEPMTEYMASNDGQETIIQEYLTDMEYLNNKVEELLATLTLVEQNLSESVEQYREGDIVLTEEITSLHTEVSTIIQNLKEMQTNLYDLIDVVQIMEGETIPVIREQITQIRGDMNTVHTDIAKLYRRITALQQEDSRLWEGIDDAQAELQQENSRLWEGIGDAQAALQQEDSRLWEGIDNAKKALQTALNRNMAEVNDQFDVVLEGIEALEDRLWTGIGNTEETLQTALDQNMTEVNNRFDVVLEGIEALENRLGTGIGNTEETLQTVLNQNMTEVNNRFDITFDRIEALEDEIERLAGQVLLYRYDEGENTLYLEPYKE